MSISFNWAVWGSANMGKGLKKSCLASVYLYSLGNPRKAPPSPTSLKLIFSHSPARLPKPHPRLIPAPGPSLCPPSGWDSSTAPQIRYPATAPPSVPSRNGCPPTTLPSGLGSAHKVVPSHSPAPRVGLSRWRWPSPLPSLALTKQTRIPRRRLGCKATAPPAALTQSPAMPRCLRLLGTGNWSPWLQPETGSGSAGRCWGRSSGAAYCAVCKVFSAGDWVHVVRSALVRGSGLCERRAVPGLP